MANPYNVESGSDDTDDELDEEYDDEQHDQLELDDDDDPTEDV